MKKFTVLVLTLVLCAGVLAGCRRGRVDNTSEPTLLPTTHMTEGTVSPSTMDTTPATVAPTVPENTGTEPSNPMDGTDGMMDGTDGMMDGTGSTGSANETTMPNVRTKTQRPY